MPEQCELSPCGIGAGLMSEESERMLREMRQTLDGESQIPSDDPPLDYLSAAAAVVEAARELDAAKGELNALNEATLTAFEKTRGAEKKLSGALENLKSADTGRKGL